MNVVVVGLGYVGAVTAACLSKLGHTVVGVDIDPHKLEPLERGVEPDRRARARRAGGVGQGVEPAPRVVRSRGLRAATLTSSSCPSGRPLGATARSTSASWSG